MAYSRYTTLRQGQFHAEKIARKKVPIAGLIASFYACHPLMRQMMFQSGRVQEIVEAIFAADPTPEKEYVQFICAEYLRRMPLLQFQNYYRPRPRKKPVRFDAALYWLQSKKDEIRGALMAYNAIKGFDLLELIDDNWVKTKLGIRLRQRAFDQSLWGSEYIRNFPEYYRRFASLRDDLYSPETIEFVNLATAGRLPDDYKKFLQSDTPSAIPALFAAPKFHDLVKSGDIGLVASTEKFWLCVVHSEKGARYLSPRRGDNNPTWCIAHKKDFMHFQQHAAAINGYQYILLTDDGTNGAYTLIGADNIANELNIKTSFSSMFRRHQGLRDFIASASTKDPIKYPDLAKIAAIVVWRRPNPLATTSALPHDFG